MLLPGFRTEQKLELESDVFFSVGHLRNLQCLRSSKVTTTGSCILSDSLTQQDDE